MTKEAIKFCDKIYLTSDNLEMKENIFEDMKKGILKNLENISTINNRKKQLNTQ